MGFWCHIEMSGVLTVKTPIWRNLLVLASAPGCAVVVIVESLNNDPFHPSRLIKTCVTCCWCFAKADLVL
jgi:hypothetical protein